MTRVYLDHNATTPLRPEAREALVGALGALAGNASSAHSSGRAARAMLDSARERVAAALEVDEDEIVFTSGGTEANNAAILGSARAARESGSGTRAVVTTAVEHSSVLGAVERAEREQHATTIVPVDAHGRPTVDALVAAAEDACIVSAMAANNEVGSTTRLAELAHALDARYAQSRPVLHTDAVQALGRLPVRLREWGVDLASFSAHKVGGPLGCGVLYRKTGAALEPLLYGGGQESGLRPGTENVPAIVATARAIELAIDEQQQYAERTRTLAATLWHEVRSALPDACLLGPPIDGERLPNTLNVLLPDVDGRVLVTRLDLEGLEASAGSACASGSLEPSHVLIAMGLDAERARAGVRLSLGRDTTDADIHMAVEMLSRTFSFARKSPRHPLGRAQHVKRSPGGH